jgi:hypothetical protein
VTTKSICVSLAALAIGCGAKIAVDVDLNGTTGDALKEAFFATAARVNQPTVRSEDRDDDGNLDVDEDANGNGLLDDGEDLDGDGKLDILDEDTNDNGALDIIEVDTNGDGAVDASDNSTQAVFLLVASGGEVSCDNFLGLLANDGSFSGDDTLFAAFGFQDFASAGDNTFSAGNTAAPFFDEDRGDFVFTSSLFGAIEDGRNGVNFGDDTENTTITFDQLDDELSATITATLIDGERDRIPLTAKLRRIGECAAMSASFQADLDEGRIPLR